MTTLIQAARGHVGTPFAWGQAARGVGMDCVGLLLLAGQELGLLPESMKRSDFAAMDHPAATALALGSWMDASAGEAGADVALVGSPKSSRTSHILIVGGGRLVTASALTGCVVESQLDARLRGLVVSWWSVRLG